MAKQNKTDFQNVPAVAAGFINRVISKMRYRKKIRRDVQVELVAHFEDELKDCATDQEKDQKAQQLIADFGDAKLLAVLLRRAKKRCRPFWRTVAARTLQITGLLALCLGLYVFWFYSGEPVITTDYAAQLSRLVRPPADESQNAAPFYRKAGEMLAKVPDETANLLGWKPSELTPDQRRTIREFFASNTDMFDLITIAASKPYYWEEYEGNDDGFLTPMTGLPKFRRFAFALRLRAYHAAERGRYEAAFGDLKSICRLARHLRNGKTFIELLVGTAIDHLAVKTLFEILAEHQIDSALLAVLQADFEQISATEDVAQNLTAERLFAYDVIQRTFTGGRDGHVIPRKIKIGSSGFAGTLPAEDTSRNWFLELTSDVFDQAHLLFAHPDKQETIQCAEQLYELWEHLALKTPAQIRAEGTNPQEKAMQIAKGNLLLEPSVGASVSVIGLIHRRRATVQAALVVIAAMRYRSDKGFYPENLQELLTTGYLQELPMDPYSDKPLVYKKTGDNFTLYSLGPNFEDDDGQRGKTEKGQIAGGWRDNGDTVFWPLLELQSQ
jgi:hypothetical protein